MSIKTLIVRAVTFLSGLYFFLEFILPKQIRIGSGAPLNFSEYHEGISNGFSAVAACAVGLGVLNLLLHHGKKIIWRDTGALYSITLLGSLALTLFVLSADWVGTLKVAREVSYFSMLGDFSHKVINAPNDAEHARLQLLLVDATKSALAKYSSIPALREKSTEIQSTLDGTPISYDRLRAQYGEFSQVLRASNEADRSTSYIASLSTILIDGLFTALGSAMFSLLGFYIAAAAYRAFRVKSFESGLLMGTAVIVMLGQIPFGIMLWDGMPSLRLWFLQVPSAAAARAIEIGASVAGLILAFRMWLSIESGSFRSK